MNSTHDGPYAIDIQRVTHLGDTPIDEAEAEIDAWRSLSFWQRLRRGRPHRSAIQRVSGETVRQRYASADEADAEARRIADQLRGERDDTGVAVISVDGFVVSGWYVNGGGSY